MSGRDLIPPLAAAAIDTDAVGTDELDLSITPTWTGDHTWDAEIILTNTNFLQGEDSSGNKIQLIGVTAGNRVLVGDVAGLGHVTDIEADGTTVMSAQTAGHANFDNGNIRVNADGNAVEWGASQDAAMAYVAADDILDLTGKGLRASGGAFVGQTTGGSRRIGV